MKKSFILAAKLFLICAVAAAALALTNAVTKPVIDEMKEKAKQEAYREVYAEAEEFKVVEDESLLNANILEIVEAKIGGKVDGYIFNVNSPSGYDGPVNFVIGTKVDGTVVGFKVLAHTETTGFGSRVTNPEYAQGMNGVVLNAPVEAKGNGGEEHSVPAMTGATLTTNAMVGGFNAVVEKLAELAK